MYIWRYIKTRCIHHSYFFNFAMRWLSSSLFVLPWVRLSSDMTELNTNHPHNNYILKYNKRNKLSSNYCLFLSLFVPLSVITVENLSLLWALAKELARIIAQKFINFALRSTVMCQLREHKILMAYKQFTLDNLNKGILTQTKRIFKYRVFIKYCVFFQEFLKACHLSLASTRLLLVVQKITC